jgi:NTE family protein
MGGLMQDPGVKKTFGLALGGGGVRGLAHIPVLEELDELGLRPSAIAGTSMGALIGALYASGMTGGDIRLLIEEHTLHHSHGLKEMLEQGNTLLEWVTSLLPEIHRGGLVNVDRLLGKLLGKVGEGDFEQLLIPLYVVTTDFWSSGQVILESGPVLQAVRASMAVPGIFAPVTVSGRVLIDGGVVNNLPYDLLTGWLDVVIAVDVCSERTPGMHSVPSTVESIMGALDIMQAAELAGKLEISRPDILIRHSIRDIGILEFGKSGEVLDGSAGVREELRAKLAACGLIKG